MSRLVIISAGPATTVQDQGRSGVQRYGLPPSGAMDQASLAIANCLVENPPLGAAIEIGPFGAVLSARQGAVRVALAGASRKAEIAGQPVDFNRTLVIGDTEELRLGPVRDGVFSYLAIEGGIAGKPVFGSVAVNARAGLGSPFPRNLQAGDAFETGDIRALHAERKFDRPAADNSPIRVVLGPQDDEFEAPTLALLLESDWSVSSASDRMGYRIEGPRLVHTRGHNIISDGTVTGSIQVPGSGQPIVLMADRGTTGGYPKIATVISADIGRLAQKRIGEPFRFRAVSVDEAQLEARRFDSFLASLPRQISEIDAVALNIAALQNANLAGVAVNAIDAATWQQTTIEQGKTPS